MKFDPKLLRLSESGIDPRCRLAKALGLFQPVINGYRQRIFDIGHAIEAKAEVTEIRKRFSPVGLQIFKQAEIIPWSSFKKCDIGHEDYVIFHPQFNSGKPFFWEIKSTSPQKMEDEIPFSHTIYQCQSYCLFPLRIGKDYFPPMRQGYLTYVDRTGIHPAKHFTIKQNRKIQKEIIFVLQKLRKCISEKRYVDDPAFWEIDLKKYYLPEDFAKWRKQYAEEHMFDCMDMPVQTNIHLLSQSLIQKYEFLSKKEEKEIVKSKLNRLYNSGISEVFLPDGRKASLYEMQKSSFNYDGFKDSGLEMPDFLLPFLKTQKSFCVKIPKKGENYG
ncbi:MAG: hypothetical protein PHW62_06030 [Candidatus Ratteibacteria bacterium]|nr:hypothetical protein [Candidatus Ratteibacteria bacterium]